MSLWPNNHKVSFVVLTGDFGSGKTSFALNIDPVLKGKGEGRTLHFDMENSAEAFVDNYEFDRFDMPRLTRERYGDSWTLGQLNNLWWEIADRETKNKHYTVMVIDDWSPLQEGAFMTVTGNDVMDKWTKLKADFETKLRLLETRVDTIVVIVHLRGKKDKSKEKEAKGIDTLTKLATLKLYLHRDPQKTIKIKGVEMQECPRYPYPTGYILKSRLEKVSDKKDEFGDYLRKSLIPDRIPVCTPGALRRYMSNPSVEFTDEEQMPDEVPGLVEETTEQEKLDQQEKIQEDALKLKTIEGRNKLIDELIQGKYYTDLKAITAATKVLGIAYNVEQHHDIYNQLVDYAEKLQEKDHSQA